MFKKIVLFTILILSINACKSPKALQVINDEETTNNGNNNPAPLTCPTNFVKVPGNTALNTEEFCVAKFHSKNYSGNVGVTSTNAPWDNIDANAAQAKCEVMTETGFNGTFTLISNPEWMTIARNAEAVTDNWESGIVGTGWFVRGHTDGVPNNSLDVTDENDPYNGTGDTAGVGGGNGWEQRRTIKLSNGSVIWDFTGNVWSWVDWNPNDTGFTLAPTDAAFTSMEVDVLSGSITHNDLRATGLYNSSQGFGQWYGGTGGAAMRGGRWTNQTLGGIYSMYLDEAASHSSGHVGFRCVYRP